MKDRDRNAETGIDSGRHFDCASRFLTACGCRGADCESPALLRDSRYDENGQE
jgi:hypothetical protein